MPCLSMTVALLAACAQRPEAPRLPPLALTPRLETLRQHAAAAPAAPASERLRELAELVESAFLGSGRTAFLAQRALGEAEDAVFALEAGLLHAEAPVRAGCAQALGERGHQPSLIPLALRLKYETDGVARLRVAAALAALGCLAGLDEVRKGFGQEELANVAGEAAIGISKQRDIALAAEPTWDELGAALAKLQASWRATGRDVKPVEATAATRARLATLLVTLEGFALRPVDDARFVLVRLGALGLSELGVALGASERYLRSHALEVVRDLGRAALPLVGQVLPLLGDPLVRADAARALGELGARQALPHLLLWLASPDAELRTAAAMALGPLGDRAAIPPLQARLDDANEAMDVRVAAAFSLALFENDRPARAFLVERKQKADYHAPTIDELLDRVDRGR